MSGNKKEALADFNRQRICETAERLFCERGFARVTVDDIAKEADYSKSTIYAYFKSKEDIYNHIVHANMTRLRDDIQQCAEMPGSVKACYLAICGRIAAFSEQNPIYLETICGDIGVEQQDFDEFPILREIYEVGEQIDLSVTALLQRGIKSGDVREDIDPLQTTFTLWAGICGVIMLAHNKERYLIKGLKTTRCKFLDDSFATLWNAVATHDNAVPR